MSLTGLFRMLPVGLLCLAASLGCSEADDASSGLPTRYEYPPSCQPRQANDEGDLVWLERLSDTGCADTSAAIAYDVRVPLWSDGAEKHRWIWLPPDAAMTETPSGPWELPVDSVLIKDFELGGSTIETRLLVREGNAWIGASYRWDGADAFLVPDGLNEDVGGVNWRYPSHEDCRTCHLRASGYVLGVSTEQLNRSSDMFGLGSVHQIDGLTELGLLAPADAGSIAAPLAPLDDPTAGVEYRVRSYLAANCAGCHVPGGAAHSDLDLRMRTPLGQTGLCSLARESYGLRTGARIVDPGNPSASVLPHLMRITGEGQMPPLARTVVDEEAVALIEEWITALDSCE